MFGIGLAGSIVIPVYAVMGDVMTSGGLEPGYVTAAMVCALVLVAWSVMRAVFAVKIWRRSSGARIGAIVLEAIGLALTVVASFVITAIISPTGETDPSAIMCSSTGFIPSLLIITLLLQTDSKRWCER
jgi:hypothetical protein